MYVIYTIFLEIVYHMLSVLVYCLACVYVHLCHSVPIEVKRSRRIP